MSQHSIPSLPDGGPWMSADEQAIRDFFSSWFDATASGDLPRLLSLLSDDVVFLTPGRLPFGRDAFAASFSASSQQYRIKCEGQREEIAVAGDLAYVRARLSVSLAP